MKKPHFTPEPPVPACVYLLLRRDRRRFKLGWSHDPQRRVRLLPEYAQRKLDLPASKAVWLPSRPRAEEVERALHKALKPFRVQPGHQLDGSREWFAGRAQDAALQLLGRMPLGDGATATIAPLLQPVPGEDPPPPERWADPLSVWWGVEDLLLRLAAHCPVSVGAGPVVTVHGLRAGRHQEILELRSIALDAERWQCRQGGRPLSFVQTLAWEQDDLVLRFMPLRQIERWDDGAELVPLVQGFLVRLKTLPRAA